MSYTNSHNGRGASSLSSALTAASSVVQDPCFGRVTQQVLTLRDLQRSSKPTATGATSSSTKGIGLCLAVKPLDLVITMRKKPWLLPLAVSALFGGVFLLGYVAGSAGKVKRKKP